MTNPLSAFLILIGFVFIPIKDILNKENQIIKKEYHQSYSDKSIIYKTKNLIIKKLSSHIYEHISYLQTDDFGKVSCNGMIVINNNKAIVFDTPTDNKSSLELINFITKTLKTRITAVIPTHFHEDCIGGLTIFEEYDIQLYVTHQTLNILKENGHVFSKPVKEFNDLLQLDLDGRKIYAQYFGEGHSKDNIIGYSPKDNAIFGGCLIKTVGASKGYLGDANTNQWPETVNKIKLEYPNVNIVIPGHGKFGGSELFDYTIELFE